MTYVSTADELEKFLDENKFSSVVEYINDRAIGVDRLIFIFDTGAELSIDLDFNFCLEISKVKQWSKFILDDKLPKIKIIHKNHGDLTSTKGRRYYSKLIDTSHSIENYAECDCFDQIMSSDEYEYVLYVLVPQDGKEDIYFENFLSKTELNIQRLSFWDGIYNFLFLKMKKI